MNRVVQIPFVAGCVFALLLMAFPAAAQEIVSDAIVTMKARVLEVISQERRTVPGIGVEADFQVIKVEILDEPERGKILTLENDFLNLKAGDVFYLTHTTNPVDATDHYAVSEPYRLPQLAFLLFLFIALVLIFGGKQGLRGLLSLGGSLFFIAFLLLPGILRGYPPVLVAVGVSSLIVLIGSYVTHGFSKMTSTAVVGMIVTVSLTGILAYVSIPFAHLSGFVGEETTYLNLNTGGTINLAGLLIGAILIGTLGVLYDAAIGQAVAVEELAAAGAHLSRRDVYRRALRIGREHVGALVNTLAIAYVGASLPLLLLFYGFGTDSIAITLNRELFATEIVRTIVGSIGLVLAVPITTAVAAYFLVQSEGSKELKY